MTKISPKRQNQISKLHRKAMEFADSAFMAEKSQNYGTARELFDSAFQLESEAARSLINEFNQEPTRSVFFRSAATLALYAGKTLEAERLVASALSGFPPDEIAQELRDLLEDINFQRHLSLRGITLEPGELQLSISGNEVSYGMAAVDEFVQRVADLERMVYRTAERRQKKPYRERGDIDRTSAENLNVYMSAPRGGSFSVTLRLGRQSNLFESTDAIIDDIVENLGYFNVGELEKIKEKIVDEAYARNFIGLAKRLAPDGEKISSVGISTIRDGKPRNVQLLVSKGRSKPNTSGDEQDKSRNRIDVTGILRYADYTSSSRRIKIIDDEGKTHSIIVPEGLMEDVVKPYWDTRVAIYGVRKGNFIHLEDIQPAQGINK
jgi:hypothetical protein